MGKYLITTILLVIACNKDNTSIVKISDLPKKKHDNFIISYHPSKENVSSFWGIKIISSEEGVIMLKYTSGLIGELFTTKLDTMVYIEENYGAQAGDTIWFSPILPENPNYEIRYQVGILAKTIDN